MINEKDLNKWLRNYNFENLDFEFLKEKKAQSKELFSLNTTILFWELCIKRLQELQEGYLSSKINVQRTNMALMERAALETFAVGVVQILSFKGLVDSGFKNKRKNLDYEERAKKLFLGTKKMEHADKITATNIMSHLRTIEKYLTNVGSDGLIHAYEDLSNICHPNMPGLTGEYFVEQMLVSKKGDIVNKESLPYFTVVLLLVQYFDETIQDLKKVVRPSSLG